MPSSWFTKTSLLDKTSQILSGSQGSISLLQLDKRSSWSSTVPHCRTCESCSSMT